MNMNERYDNFITFKNPFNYDFEFGYGGEIYVIKANSTTTLPSFLAEHGINKLVQRQLGDGSDPRILDKDLFGRMFKALIVSQSESPKTSNEKIVLPDESVNVEKAEEFGGINQEEELRSLDRKELQEQAKGLGIRGNQTSEELIKQILEKENIS